MSLEAIKRALDDAGMESSELDLIIVATVTMEMTCPSTACRIAAAIGATPAGAFDITAACSGFLYAFNLADSLIRSGRHKKIGVIGCDTMSSIVDYSDRGTSILFGDAAGAAILVADEDRSRGCMYQKLQANGNDWPSLYLPRREQERQPEDEPDNALGWYSHEGPGGLQVCSWQVPMGNRGCTGKHWAQGRRHQRLPSATSPIEGSSTLLLRNSPSPATACTSTSTSMETHLPGLWDCALIR